MYFIEKYNLVLYHDAFRLELVWLFVARVVLVEKKKKKKRKKKRKKKGKKNVSKLKSKLFALII